VRPQGAPRGPAARLALAAAVALPGCAATPEAPPAPARAPTLAEYRAFRAGHPDLLEPNYLPFMTHPTPAGNAQVFCRWPDAAMPLAVHIVAPEIAESLQDEFAPRAPSDYVRAVERALGTWEAELEGRVRFRRVEDPRDARIVLRLVGEQAGASDDQRDVLGETPDASRCRIEGGDAAAGVLRVDFEVRESRLYLADGVGLLAPDLFEWVALHEIGHALGMRGHSPVPADLMYAVARDRTLGVESHRIGVPGLAPEDVNSFVSLYELPNGAVFAGGAAPGPVPPALPGPPELAIGPYVDARLGFEFRPPRGWMRVPTSQGVAVLDGVTWEPSPSLQIVVHRYDTIEEFLARYGSWYRRRGRVSLPERLDVAGRRALRVSIADREGLAWEEVTLIESGDGRILVATGECPPELAGEYRPWFRAAVASLEISGAPPGAR